MCAKNTRIQNYFDKLSDKNIRFSPYTIKNVGLIPNQTILKISDFMLICSPYQISMKNAVLLLILSHEETQFFQQYKDTNCSLCLVFQKSLNTSSFNMEIPSKVDQIGAVKGKKNICMINISFIKFNSQLIEILGNYIFGHNALKECLVKYEKKDIGITVETAKNLRYNNYFEVICNNNKCVGQLLSLSVDKLIFSVNERELKIAENMNLSCKLYFHLYRFIISGKIIKVDKTENGIQKVHYAFNFSPELTEILDDYFYRIQYVE